jgi:hypothetical protein
MLLSIVKDIFDETAHPFQLASPHLFRLPCKLHINALRGCVYQLLDLVCWYSCGIELRVSVRG